MANPPVLADFGFVHRLRVRWAEVDAQGIVFNPNYLVFADVGWTEYMRAAGWAYPSGLTKLGVDLFAVHAELDFFGSAAYDDELDIAVRTLAVGRTSLRIEVGMFRGQQALCRVGLVYVVASIEEKKPQPVPEAFAQGLRALDR